MRTRNEELAGEYVIRIRRTAEEDQWKKIYSCIESLRNMGMDVSQAFEPNGGMNALRREFGLEPYQRE